MEIGKIMVQVQPRQKVSKTPISRKRVSVVEHFCNPSYAGGISRLILVPGQARQKARLYLKNNLKQK
jgi:hypothetical protein